MLLAGLSVLVNDADAQIYAFVTDEDLRAGDELANLVLTLAAEGIVEDLLAIHLGRSWLVLLLQLRELASEIISIALEPLDHYRLIVACMPSGASRDRPVIVGWSTALRGQVINESLGQLPKKLAAGPRVLARTESSGTQSGTKQGGPPHDHWAKLGQLRYTRSQYSFVAIAIFSMKFIAPPSTKKELSALQACNCHTPI
jgi:hypothetical protein